MPSFFKKKARWEATKTFVKNEGIGTLYPGYKNGDKDHYVCKHSRDDQVHDGFDPKIQAVKMADIWGIEKVWRGQGSTRLVPSMATFLPRRVPYR